MPNSTRAIALPPSEPGYQASSTAPTRSLHGVSTGPPLTITTAVLGLAAATCSIRASWSPKTGGHSSVRQVRSTPSVEYDAATTTATSDAGRELGRPRGVGAVVGRDRDAGPGHLLDPLERRRRRERLDLGGAAAGQVGVGAGADHGDRVELPAIEREQAVVVEQHDSLLGDAPRRGCVRGLVDRGLVGLVGSAVDRAVGEQRAQVAEDVPVDVGDRRRAGRERGADRQRAVDDPGPRLDVEAVDQRGAGVVGGPVVGDRHALEAPVAAQDVLEQRLVLAAEEAVDAVVGAHDRGHVRPLHSCLEHRQVELAHRPLVDPGVDPHPVADRREHAERDREVPGPGLVGGRPGALLVVARVVLDVGDQALRLSRLDPRHRELGGEVGILAAERLEDAARRAACGRCRRSARRRCRCPS